MLQIIYQQTEEEEEEDYIYFNQAEQTRRLLVRGLNVNEFVKILATQTKAQITLKTSPQEKDRGVIHFKSPVRASLIQKVLECSSLQLVLLVSKSTSSKASNSFLSSSSSSAATSSSFYEEEIEQLYFLERSISSKVSSTNNNNYRKGEEEYEQSLFFELSSLLIRNSTWEISDLYAYIVAQKDEKKITFYSAIITPKKSQQQQQFSFIKMQEEEEEEEENKSTYCATAFEQKIQNHSAKAAGCTGSKDRVNQTQDKSIPLHLNRHGKNARESRSVSPHRQRENIKQNE
ncbi:hypothetical protein ABPG72_017881 [Tetrahymena utriculariae]